MTIHTPFSERERKEIPDIHFELTDKIRQQISFTLRNNVHEEFLRRAARDYEEHHGKQLLSSMVSLYASLGKFLQEAEPPKIFDFVEFCLFRVSEEGYNTLEVVERLNKWFKLSGYGYEIRELKFERVDSKYLKEEAIKPALTLLQKERFEGALGEFEAAIKFQRDNKWEDAIKKANDSFESTMKEILGKRGVSLDRTDTASNLIKKLKDDGILDPPLLSFADSVRTTLESGLPTLRNVIPGAGHGRGKAVDKEYQTYCNFALHLAGSLIVFLIERYEEEENHRKEKKG